LNLKCKAKASHQLGHSLTGFLSWKMKDKLEKFCPDGFSSRVPLWVTSGRLCFDSLAAKALSDLYDDSCSNFQQSNAWQKVQFNTDLLIQGHCYLYRAKWRWFKQKWHLRWLKMRLFLIRQIILINAIKKGFYKTKWKWAGSGSAGDFCKSSTLLREVEKMRMHNFCVFTEKYFK